MTKEKFMQFVNSEEMTADNGCYCKVIQNGVTYVLFGNVSENNLLNDRKNKMEVAGFIYKGRFYGVHYYYREYDLDFKTAVADFEKKFNEAYKAAKNRFTLENPAPITEITQKAIDRNYSRCTEKDFEYYKEYQAVKDAKQDMFEIVCNYGDNNTNMEKFTPIFFDC